MNPGRLSISIGIPAYNEEKNIKSLLLNLLNQKGYNFDLTEIIINLDGSLDSTYEMTKSINNEKVKVVFNTVREGKIVRQNEISQLFTGDVLVLLDADVLPEVDFIQNIVNKFFEDSNVGIVGGNVVPLTAKSFVEKVINWSAKLKQEIFERMSDTDNIYLCHGRVRAFSKSFVKNFVWPEPISSSEDAYSYLKCREMGYKFYFEKNAVVYYRSPQSLHDHFKQSVRFFICKNNLYNYFAKNTIANSFRIPRILLFRVVLKYGIRNPLYLFLYLSFFFVSKILSYVSRNINPTWDISDTTKQLLEKQ